MATKLRSRKRARSPSPNTTIKYTESSPINDRGSIFLALYSATAPATSLQSHPSISSATHRILAWRLKSNQSTLSSLSNHAIYRSGHDDDGEKYAGKKLETLLNATAVEGAIVVARWYGGVMLGPIRFTHIEHVAKEAISKSKMGQVFDAAPSGMPPEINLGVSKTDRISQEDEERVKTRKEDPVEPEIRNKLVEILEQRDQSILSLRGMLTDKRRKAALRDNSATAESEGSQDEKFSGIRSHRPPLNYFRMPLDVLRRLEVARDATIAWILNEIDEAENTLAKTATSEHTQYG